MVSPLLGNQQLVQGGVLFTSARQLANSVSTSVSPGFSAGAISGGLVCKSKTVAKTRMVMPRCSAELFEEGTRGRLQSLT